jgi:hypothetical protein
MKYTSGAQNKRMKGQSNHNNRPFSPNREKALELSVRKKSVF